MSYGLYTHIHVSKEPWIDIYTKFILGLSRSRKGRDYFFFVIYRFSKMTPFISCYKTNEKHI
jgi:hypothetical protein